MKDITIGARLVLSFAVIVLLMMFSSLVSLNQLYAMHSQALRLQQVNQQAAAVMQVHNDVLAFKDTLNSLAYQGQAGDFVTSVGQLQQNFENDVQAAIRALQPERVHGDTIGALQGVQSSLTAQAEIFKELAQAGDWEAIQLRLNNQVHTLSQVTRGLSGAMIEDVNTQQALALRQMEAVQQRATYAVVITALLIVPAAILLGFSLTRSIATPLNEITGVARQIGAGNLDVQATPTVGGEIGTLARTMNTLTGQVKAMIGGLESSVADLQRTREEMHRSERYFRALIENALDVTMVLDPRGPVRYASPTTSRMLGYLPEELVGKHILKFIHPGDRQWVLFSSDASLGQPGTAQRVLFRFRHKDGRWLTLEGIGNNLTTDPSVRGIVASFRDVSERVVAEEKLRARLQLEKAISTISTRLINLPGEEIGAALAEALELIGRVTNVQHSFLHQVVDGVLVETQEWCLPGSRPPIGQKYRGMRLQENAWSWNQLQAGKAVHIASIRSLPPEAQGEKAVLAAAGIESLITVPLFYENRLVGLLGSDTVRAEKAWPEEDLALLKMVGETFVNAYERRKAENTLRENEARYRAISELTSDYAYALRIHPDGSTSQEWVTEAYSRITGYDAGEAGSMPDLTLPEDAPVFLEHRQQLFTGHPHECECRITRKDGETRWIRSIGRPIWSETEKRVVRIYGAVQDITDRKRREREQEVVIGISASLRPVAKRAELLPVILEKLMDLLKFDAAVLATRSPGRDDMLIELGRGEWAGVGGLRLTTQAGITQKAIEKGQPYWTDDGHLGGSPDLPDWVGKCTNLACMPLYAQGQVIGALWAGRRSTIREEDILLLASLGEVIASAVHRISLHEQTEQRLQRITSLRAIDMAISASLDLNLTLNILLDHVTSQLTVDAAGVLLFDPNLQMLNYSAGRGFRSRSYERTQLRLGEGGAGRAALERRPIVLPYMGADPRLRGLSSLLASEDFQAYYGIPLLAKGSVKGVLEVFHRGALEANPEWIDFIEVLAGQAAIAIDNAELFQKLQRSNTELALAYDITLEGWVKALDLRDKETEGHTLRVTDTTLRIARHMGMSDERLIHLRRGALLHDIGKIAIPDQILLKPGPLTAPEWEIMREHPIYAHQLLSPIDFLKPALEIPYNHHERWDGSGYPRHLKGEEIPLAARIFSVVDVWDALSSDRPYRPAWPEEQVLDYLHQQSGKHFEPAAVDLFIKVMEGVKNPLFFE